MSDGTMKMVPSRESEFDDMAAIPPTLLDLQRLTRSVYQHHFASLNEELRKACRDGKWSYKWKIPEDMTHKHSTDDFLRSYKLLSPTIETKPRDFHAALKAEPLENEYVTFHWYTSQPTSNVSSSAAASSTTKMPETQNVRAPHTSSPRP